MLLASVPQTPLRVLCVGAFEYLAGVKGGTLGRRKRRALALACDFGALRNDFYDQRTLDRSAYRSIRSSLRALAPQDPTGRYIRDLRQVERRRPEFQNGRFPEPAAVMEYRSRVLTVSLRWMDGISGRHDSAPLN